MESRLVSLLLGELELAPIGNLHLPMPATRADTLRDVELIDVTKGSRLGDPVAVAAAAWADCVEWPETKPAIQSESGRLRNMLFLAAAAAVRKGGGRPRVLRGPTRRRGAGANSTSTCWDRRNAALANNRVVRWGSGNARRHRSARAWSCTCPQYNFSRFDGGWTAGLKALRTTV